jgi:hypothetical protein
VLSVAGSPSKYSSVVIADLETPDASRRYVSRLSKA